MDQLRLKQYHDNIKRQCDEEFKKLLRGKLNIYHRLSARVTSIRKEMGILAKDPCPNAANPRKGVGRNRLDCRYCVDCNLSLAGRAVTYPEFPGLMKWGII